jgi:hypothetical protein
MLRRLNFIKCILWLTLFAGPLSLAKTDSKCWPTEFYKTLTAEEAPLLKDGLPESGAITRKQVALKGRYEPEVAMIELDANDTATALHLKAKAGKTLRYGNYDYIEFPNSTAFRTTNKITGEEREFILTRGVRPYQSIVKEKGNQETVGYVSDVLLFERAKNGRFVYRDTIMESAPEKFFKFEDPRVSIIYGSTGKQHIFLSGTDYSPHVPGSTNPDVMNRYVKLDIDREGMVKKVKVDPATGKPNFQDMSPAPQLGADGHYSFVDAKNGTIARNEKGEIVLRVRLRPDFGNKQIQKLAGNRQWHYGEQVYVFKDWNEFRRYDWKHSLEDLFQPKNTSGAANRIRPVEAKEILRDTDLVEHYKDARVMLEKGKGMGPGSIPVRIRREGNKLFISDGKGATERYAGTIPKNARDRFVVGDGEVKYLTPDHEIRYFSENGFTKRHYTASFKLFNDDLTKMELYYADAIQPITLRERGVTSGIPDLQHTYPMGRTIVPGKAGRKAKVRIFSGTSDANTSEYEMDVLNFLLEMSPGSERRLSGQVYEIHR